MKLLSDRSIRMSSGRQMVLAAICLSVASVVHADVLPAATLSWHFDEAAGASSAVDASGNGYTGTVSSNLTTGVSGISGQAYSGFNTSISNVYYDFNSGAVNTWSQAFTLSLWIKNPTLTSGQTAVIARGGSDPVSTNWVGDQAWQLSIDGSTGQLQFALQSWNAASTYVTSSAVNWASDTWYQVAFTFTPSTDGNGQVAHVQIYVTEAGATSVSSLLDTDIHFAPMQAGNPAISNLIVGAAPGASWGTVAASFFGGSIGGQIDEVNLWLGQALTADQLSQALIAVPEPAVASMLALGGLTLLFRRK